MSKIKNRLYTKLIFDIIEEQKDNIFLFDTDDETYNSCPLIGVYDGEGDSISAYFLTELKYDGHGKIQSKGVKKYSLTNDSNEIPFGRIAKFSHEAIYNAMMKIVGEWKNDLDDKNQCKNLFAIKYIRERLEIRENKEIMFSNETDAAIVTHDNVLAIKVVGARIKEDGTVVALYVVDPSITSPINTPFNIDIKSDCFYGISAMETQIEKEIIDNEFGDYFNDFAFIMTKLETQDPIMSERVMRKLNELKEIIGNKID